MLVENLARAMEPQVNEGDEFIVSFADHESKKNRLSHEHPPLTPPPSKCWAMGSPGFTRQSHLSPLATAPSLAQR